MSLDQRPDGHQPSFQYTYSAKEQAELKRIRDKYTDPMADTPVSTMEQIRQLDAGVTRRATIVALMVGVISTLIMGLGMSLVMTELKTALAIPQAMALPLGIAVGVVGMIGVIAAYPLYQRVLARERRKAAPRILQLTDELTRG